MMKAPDAHRRGRGLLRVLNWILDVAVILAILLAMAYSIYSIWDNNSIYQAAMDLSARIRREKPEGEKPSFEDLQKINKDVCAWVSLEGTQIDNPVVQGSDNEEYLNKDVYGDYSLAGTLFLDTRCNRDFTDFNELVYGHHMDRHQMFGDLDLYLEKDFFDKHTDGMLLIPGQKIPVTVFSVMVVSSRDQWIFDPVAADEEPAAYLDYVSSESKYVRTDLLGKIKAEPERYHVLTLSTCSTYLDENRTIVLAAYELTDKS